jgi:hypothetical protein
MTKAAMSCMRAAEEYVVQQSIAPDLGAGGWFVAGASKVPFVVFVGVFFFCEFPLFIQSAASPAQRCARERSWALLLTVWGGAARLDNVDGWSGDLLATRVPQYRGHRAPGEPGVSIFGAARLD